MGGLVRELHLFAGAGGGILGGHLLGHTTVCAVEIEPYCRKVLLQRQRDGILPKFPIWDDVTTFDGNPWRGKVDVVCGGFPCQDISCAGGGAGLSGERSGLWSEMARIIGEVRPRLAFVENSPMLTLRGLDRVIGDLTEMGYDAKWGVVSASNTGAPHRRERIWIFANSKGSYVEKQKVVGAALQKRAKGKFGGASSFHAHTISAPSWYGDQPGMVGLDDGFSKYVDRAKAAGNAQVPIVAATAWRVLTA